MILSIGPLVSQEPLFEGVGQSRALGLLTWEQVVHRSRSTSGHPRAPRDNGAGHCSSTHSHFVLWGEKMLEYLAYALLALVMVGCLLYGTMSPEAEDPPKSKRRYPKR